jgi:hypothetical protein
MKSIDQERQITPYSQEIEYALIVQRMINAVRDNPMQMRLTVYEFARARLKIDTSGIGESERERLLAALETAILGVERFSFRQDSESLATPNVQAQIAPVHSAEPAEVAEPLSLGDSHRIFMPADVVTPADVEILVPKKGYSRTEAIAFREARSGQLLPTLLRFGFVMLLFGIGGSFAYNKHLFPPLLIDPTPRAPSTIVQPAAAVATPSSFATHDAKPAINAPNDPGFPLPSDYGVYALSNQVLSELYALPERVPDKRIAVSTPVEQPSRTSLPDGKARFIVYRRDLGGNALDRVEIRVVARVARAITFDAKGRPNISPVSDAWNIRNVSHEFRVRPIAGNPEMLLVQSDKPDFVLPTGRYVLVLKDQGYDFTVAGKVVEAAQCLERTDAANGSFYSECLNP